MAALRNGSKCSHTTPCMLRFFTVPRLALNPNLIFEIGSSVVCQKRLTLVIGRRKPFASDIEHFRARSEALRYEASAECSVENHELFEGLMPEFS